MLKRIKSYGGEFVTNPFVLAIVPAILFIALLPFSFNKYYIEKISDKITSQMEFFHDLDQDGDTEEIRLGFNSLQGKSNPQIQIYDTPGTQLIIDQVNPNHTFVENAGPIFSDFDHDSLCEIFVFLKNDSSLYISGLEVNKDSTRQKMFPEKFVNYVRYRNGSEDYKVIPAPSADLNGDGYDEIIFAVLGLFCAQPRELCAYDLINDSIIKSQESAIALHAPIKVMDDPHRHKSKIITCYTGTSSNYKGSKPLLDDSRGWAMAFDEHLKYYFNPIPNKTGYWYSVENLPFFDHEQGGIISLFKMPRGADQNEVLRIYDFRGNILKEKVLEKAVTHHIFATEKQGGNSIWIYNDKYSTVSLIDNNLEIKKKRSVKENFPYPVKPYLYLNLDILRGSDKKSVLVGYANQILIYTDEFLHPVEVDNPENWTKFYADVVHLHNDPQPILYLSYGDHKVMYHYLFNRYYVLKYPFWGLTYFLSVLFFYLLLKKLRKLLQKKYDAERQLIDYRLKALKKQADPHFILNAVNNISSMFIAGQPDEAQGYLTKLSRLLYRGLMNAEKVTTTVRDELDFVRDYLDIQQKRFAGVFEYEITVDDETLWEEVMPENILYSFVENALNHGLRPKANNGTLSISVSRISPDLIKISIYDNGIGRKKSIETKTGNTGKGLIINNQILELYNKITNSHVSFTIYDLTDKNGKPCGTEVKLMVDTKMRKRKQHLKSLL